MKKLITLSLTIIICLKGFSQSKIDSVNEFNQNGFLEKMPVIGSFDTVKTIFLISDTTPMELMINNGHLMTGGLSYIIYGYEVFQFVSDRWNEHLYWEHLIYLDADKKQFTKTFIIWQSKNISQ